MKCMIKSIVILLAMTAMSVQLRAQARINHVAIFVKDIEASRTFYGNVIGFDTIPEPFHDGKHIWYKIGEGISLHIIEGAQKRKEYFKNQHTCFSVASVENFTEKLKRNNLGWEDRDGTKNAITTRVDGVKQIWLRDPDGYWVEINDARE
jgi:lactoylglutathione lyase